MRGKRFKPCAAFSLIEVMAATVVLAVAVVGISGYRYYAALDARKASMEAAASRIGLLLCESWRGVHGDEKYDPTSYLSSYLEIAEDSKAKVEQVTDFNLLGRYMLILDETSYHASLWWKDIKPGLRALHVSVAWVQPGQAGSAGNHPNELYRVTTYATY
ncbi:MAG: prepilin-type N-terminal cleavage/methylation domain-containing protein [Phycisphaerales bacterium]|nr:MAG: prepilin-type N-terminal cleavage/methylation domain-containing protein [Phycisphaerales bacterium]